MSEAVLRGKLCKNQKQWEAGEKKLLSVSTCCHLQESAIQLSERSFFFLLFVQLLPV